MTVIWSHVNPEEAAPSETWSFALTVKAGSIQLTTAHRGSIGLRQNSWRAHRLRRLCTLVGTIDLHSFTRFSKTNKQKKSKIKDTAPGSVFGQAAFPLLSESLKYERPLKDKTPFNDAALDLQILMWVHILGERLF